MNSIIVVIVLKDTESIWHASVKAIPYVCKFTPEPRLLKYIFLKIEDNKYLILESLKSTYIKPRS